MTQRPDTRPAQAVRQTWPVAAAAGLYIPSFQCGHRDHELTQRIRHGKLSGAHDPEFAGLLAQLATQRFPDFQPELVVSVPPRPGQPDRFEVIRGQLAKRLRAADGSSVLRQTRVIADYRQLTRAQRAAVCPGRFVAAARLHGKRVLLIDDVVTSGSQAREAARALGEAGAAGWRFAAVAQATAAPGEDPAAQLDDGL